MATAMALVLQAPAPGATRADTAIFAGGCYWGVEAVFEHLKGVGDVTSGFARPATGQRQAGPVETVRIVYDPAQITYEQLLDVFFLVAHDPTQVDRQGPDVGPQYRSVIFPLNEAQRQAARASISALESRRTYEGIIATEIAQLQAFRPVPESEQDFAEKNPTHPYIVVNDLPKIAELRRRFPRLAKY